MGEAASLIGGRPFLRALGFLIALTITGGVHIQMDTRPTASRGEGYVPRPEVAKIAALGFDSVLGDYYWLQAVQIIGADDKNPYQHAPRVARMVDVITTLDPWVDHPYRFAAIWVTGDIPEVRYANKILERSVTYHPDEWRNRFYLGFNHFYHLGENDKAAEVLARAIEIEGSPAYLRRLVARLRADTHRLDTIEAFMREMLEGVKNQPAWSQEMATEWYEEALVEIATERLARGLDKARKEYKRRNGQDIERVEDLIQGPGAVLKALPPEPNGQRWVIKKKTGEIVSSHFKRRYKVRAEPDHR